MFYNLVVMISRIFYIVFYRVKIEGCFPKDNAGYLICSNHINLLDPISIAVSIRRRVYFLGKKELFKNKFISFILLKLGCYPVDRDNVDIQTLKNSIKILKENKILCIFLEGTRSKTGKLSNFKRGAGLLANKGDVAIIPIKIKSNYKLFSEVIVKIGEPFYVTNENKRNAMDELHEIIDEM